MTEFIEFSRFEPFMRRMIERELFAGRPVICTVSPPTEGYRVSELDGALMRKAAIIEKMRTKKGTK